MQRDAPQDLGLVSWAAAKHLPWRRIQGYVYNVFWGRYTYIYLIENGLNYNHRVRLCVWALYFQTDKLLGFCCKQARGLVFWA